MAAKRCPQCGLINPQSTVVCDCGWSFMNNEMTASERGTDERPRESSAAGVQIALGIVLLIVGIAITAGTYGSAATSGGTYIIAYGPMVFGIASIVRGVVRALQ